MRTTKDYWPQVRQAREALAVLHPGLFDLDNPKPLAIGIRREIRATYPEMPAQIVRGLLWWLTIRRAYLYACWIGALRYGLDGEPRGVVTCLENEYAAARFHERDDRAVDKWADRMAA